MEPRDKEQENLSRLERAAQQTADPKTMQRKAEKPKEKFRFSLRKEDIWWMVGLAAVALLLFGVQVLINWAKTNSEFAAAAYESSEGVLWADGKIPEDCIRKGNDNFKR
jgi:ferric-dicitrate binding protein FerR (iron transport regulator)